ncbi:MAG: tetratricopeptide repeat protein [Bryobacteraceae bacterium]
MAWQIREVSERIRRQPNDADLYLKRGELYGTLQQWDPALADYDRAAQLDPQMAAVDLARGRSLFEAGRPQAALVAVDRFLTRDPRHGEGRILRARLLAGLGRHGEAAEEFSRGLATTSRPQPEHYLERANALVKAGRADDALRGLDEGLGRLNDSVTLQLAAVDLEADQKRYDSALARLDRVAARSARKDPWLARRAEILERAGRRAEAHAAYRAALAALESLPPSRRVAPATRETEKRLRAALRRLAAALKYGDIA